MGRGFPAESVHLARIRRRYGRQRSGLHFSSAAHEEIVVPQLHGVEVADRDRPAVDAEFEVVGSEAEHRPAIGARDVDVDVDHPNIDCLRETGAGRTTGGFLLGDRGKPGQQPGGEDRGTHRYDHEHRLTQREAASSRSSSASGHCRRASRSTPSAERGSFIARSARTASA